jgi:hypothetical protein
MIDLAKLIHAALRSDSTWIVVTVLAVFGAIIFGILGYMVNSAYLSSLPQFEIQMTTLNVSNPGPPYNQADNIQLVLEVNISNVGGPSAAKDWKLSVQFNDGECVEAIPVPMGEQRELTGQSYRRFRGEDALYKKTINSALQPGQIVPGVLQFILRGKSRAELLNPNTQFRLTVVDAYGKTHSATKTVSLFQKEADLHFPLIPIN